MTTANESALAPASQSGTSAPPPSQTATSDWTQGLAPELKAMIDTKGYKSPADLAQAYAHAEKAIGADKIVVPRDGVWDATARAKLGVPEKPDGYKVARPELPQGIAYDENFEKAMLPVAHRLGLTPTQVNELVKAVSTHRLGEFQTSAQASDTGRAEAERALRSEFGAGYDAKVTVAARAVQHFGGQGLVEHLNASGLGNHPEMIKAFAKIGSMMGEDSFKGGRPGGFGLSPEEAKAESARLMASDAYKNKHHPEHELAVRKMSELFEQQYPSVA